MKKTILQRILPLFAALFLACNPLPALAQEVDLAGMTDQEIILLVQQINQQLMDRGIEKTATLAKGSYYAGQEIPAGQYLFTCLATGNEWGYVTICTERGKGEQVFLELCLAPDEGEEPESFYITLKEGERLKSDVPFSLTILPGVVFK